MPTSISRKRALPGKKRENWSCLSTQTEQGKLFQVLCKVSTAAFIYGAYNSLTNQSVFDRETKAVGQTDGDGK